MQDQIPFSEPIYSSAPASLKVLDQWILWRADWKEKTSTWTKVPTVACKPSRNASPTAPAHWTDFATAQAACEECHPEECAGIGFVFTADDAFVGVDLDDARDPETGEPLEWAKPILERFAGTYTEVSPSGTGYKLWARGVKRWKGASRKHGTGAVEVFNHGRYFTFTGQRYGDAVDVTDQQEALNWLGELVFSHEPSSRHKAPASLSLTKAQEAVIAAADESDKPRDRQAAIDAMWRLSESRAASYDDWLRIGMACHSADDSEAMLTEWTRWSRTCPEKYDPAACREKWESFSNKPGGVGVGTLVAMAREDTANADHEAKLTLLREKLRLPTLAKVIRWTGAEIAFEVILSDGKRIDLGTAKQVLSVSHVRGVLFGEVGTLIAMDKRGWPETAQALSDVAESREGAERAPVFEWLEEYERANQRHNQVYGDRRDAVVGSPEWWVKILDCRGATCFRCPEGILHFDLTGFHQWLFHTMFEKITRVELVNALRRAGAERVTIDKRHDGERFQGRFWCVPDMPEREATGVKLWQSERNSYSPYTTSEGSVGTETPF